MNLIHISNTLRGLATARHNPADQCSPAPSPPHLHPLHYNHRRKRNQQHQPPVSNPERHGPENRHKRPPFRDEELRSQAEADGSPEPGIPEHAGTEKGSLPGTAEGEGGE